MLKIGDKCLVTDWWGSYDNEPGVIMGLGKNTVKVRLTFLDTSEYPAVLGDGDLDVFWTDEVRLAPDEK